MPDSCSLPESLPAEVADWIHTVITASGLVREQAEDLSAELLDHALCQLEGRAAEGDVVARMGDPARLGLRLARQQLGRELRRAMDLPGWLRALLAADLALLGPWYIAWLPPAYELRVRFGLVVLVLIVATLLSWALLGLAAFGVGLLRDGPRRAGSLLLGAGTLLTATATWFIVCMSSVANAAAVLLARWPIRHQVELLGLVIGLVLIGAALGLLLVPLRGGRLGTRPAA